MTITPSDDTAATSIEDNIYLTVDGKTIQIYFDMTMEAAINMLNHEEIDYKQTFHISGVGAAAVW